MFDRYNIETEVVPVDNDNDRYNSSRLNVATVATKDSSGGWIKYEDVKHLLDPAHDKDYAAAIELHHEYLDGYRTKWSITFNEWLLLRLNSED